MTLVVHGQVDINDIDTILRPSIRALDWDTSNNKFVIGTSGSEIIEVSSIDGQDLSKGPLIVGHFKGQLWGLAAHPTRAEIATVGDDAVVRVWDIASRRTK